MKRPYPLVNPYAYVDEITRKGREYRVGGGDSGRVVCDHGDYYSEWDGDKFIRSWVPHEYPNHDIICALKSLQLPKDVH